MALQFHEYFARIPVPETLKGKIINTEAEPIDFIENLSKINVFVGPNNSGKSYLMREILKSSTQPVYLSVQARKRVNEIITEYKSKFFELLTDLPPERKDDVFLLNWGGNGLIPSLIFKPFQVEDNLVERTEDLYNIIRAYNGMQLRTIIFLNAELQQIPNSEITIQKPIIGSDWHEIIESFWNELGKYKYLSFHEQFLKIYVHQHRSLITNKIINITENESSNEGILTQRLIEAIRNQYFSWDENGRVRGWVWVSTDEPHIVRFEQSNPYNKYCYGLHIETGLKIFDDIADMALNESRRLRAFEKFLSNEFFEGKEISFHPTNKGDKELQISLGDEEPQPIYNLGTGLQMIITLTFPIFKYKRGIMFVEEPELFVHPGLQKQLMKVYAKQENFMFFIATHSNHILDTTLYDNQISIFSVKKWLEESTSDPKFILQNLAHGDDNALTQLGVSNSSVFLANCTIWVEGVTDRMYIQKFMEVYAEKYEVFKRFKEGVHYSFVYSGGSNIAHYDFDQEGSFLKDRESPAVKYFCGKAFVVVDKDNTEDEKQAWKQKRNEKLKEILGENQFEQLEVREIENLLSLKTICGTVRSYPSWTKTRELTEDEINSQQETFKNSKIGEFIDEILFPLLKTNETDKRAKHFKAESGTINDKTEFASKAIQHIDKSSMTKEAENLAAKIYAFIESQNNF